MYYIKNAPENASLPAIFENMRFPLPLPLPLPAPAPRSQQPWVRQFCNKIKLDLEEMSKIHTWYCNLTLKMIH